jgi:hypothetical protein
MSRDSDLEKVIKNAQLQGFRYSKTSLGHHQLYAPNGFDIVTHSGTPSDVRAWDNFLAALKRAGYMELQTLGDAMPKVEKEKDGGAKLTVQQYIIDLLARHPEGMDSANVKIYISTVRPDVGESASSGALSVLQTKGAIKRMPSGIYMLADMQKAEKVKTGGRKAIVGRKEPEAKPAAPVLKTGTVSVDKDLKALDIAMNKALTALTEIDKIAHRLKEELSDYAMIKEMFTKRVKR